MTKFKNNKLQYIYELYTVDPPKTPGTGLSHYYFNGFNFPDRKNLKPIADSYACAAWAAGRDAARKIAKMKALNDA